MRYLKSVDVTEYEDGDFRVQIIVEPTPEGDHYEAWLRNVNYGLAVLMFGCTDTEDQPMDYDSFLSAVEDTLEQCECDYLEDIV